MAKQPASIYFQVIFIISALSSSGAAFAQSLSGIPDTTICRIAEGNSTMKEGAINEARRRGLGCQLNGLNNPNQEISNLKRSDLAIEGDRRKAIILVNEGGKNIRVDYPQCSETSNYPNRYDSICLRTVQFSSEGTEYIGGYQNSNFNGYGILYRNYQAYQSGIWNDGKLIRSLPIVISMVDDKKPDLPKPPPGNARTQQTQELDKKCSRLGLTPGSDDYKLCLASSKK